MRSSVSANRAQQSRNLLAKSKMGVDGRQQPGPVDSEGLFVELIEVSGVESQSCHPVRTGYRFRLVLPLPDATSWRLHLG